MACLAFDGKLLCVHILRSALTSGITGVDGGAVSGAIQSAQAMGTDEATDTDTGCVQALERLCALVEHLHLVVDSDTAEDRVQEYRPRPVRRKDIPKPNGSTRPLGIPCIWDRLIQQCIKQVMEPICGAKFSNNSYGFRPNRSVEHAVAASYRMMQLTKLHFVIEFDIKGFFDNVNHAKLMRQIWAMGIHDKHLIYVIVNCQVKCNRIEK